MIPLYCFSCGGRGKVEKLGSVGSCGRCGSTDIDIDDPMTRVAAELKCDKCGAVFTEQEDLDSHKKDQGHGSSSSGSDSEKGTDSGGKSSGDAGDSKDGGDSGSSKPPWLKGGDDKKESAWHPSGHPLIPNAVPDESQYDGGHYQGYEPGHPVHNVENWFDHQPGGSDDPKTEAKIHQIAQAVLRTNPGLSGKVAMRVARQTLARYPKISADPNRTDDTISSGMAWSALPGEKSTCATCNGKIAKPGEEWLHWGGDKDHPPKPAKKATLGSKRARLERVAEYFVTKEDGTEVGGPYKDLDAAKRGMQEHASEGGSLKIQQGGEDTGHRDSPGSTASRRRASSDQTDLTKSKDGPGLCPNCGNQGWVAEAGHCFNCGYNGPSANKGENRKTTPWSPDRSNGKTYPVSENA